MVWPGTSKRSPGFRRPDMRCTKAAIMKVDPRLGAELAGYRIEELIGRGGMSAVYLAEDLRLGRKVALKLLSPELAEDERFRERFVREARVWGPRERLPTPSTY